MFWFAMSGLWSGAAAAPENVDVVVRALSGRDGVSCEVVEGLTSTPVETLQHVVNTVSMPPWAPMNAAGCLISRHAAAVRPDLELWVTDPELKGLGRMVLGSLDVMPVEVAVPVARKALVGSNPTLAAERIAKAQTAEVRAVVSE